ncbi:MAG: (deoxy)nucleoside triphosphate pyrophosphohydrolase [Bacteroidota bacterium]|jgi:8-oxo-dGTP diphosphatase
MLRVACAVIIQNNKVLAVQRGANMKMAGKWEFPGGKLEPGETASQCIEREILEELAMNIQVEEEWPSTIHQYTDFQIELIPLRCESDQTRPILKEHQDFQWLDSESLFWVDWADADIPIRDKVASLLVSA